MKDSTRKVEVIRNHLNYLRVSNNEKGLRDQLELKGNSTMKTLRKSDPTDDNSEHLAVEENTRRS
jgi:hypothetical protein